MLSKLPDRFIKKIRLDFSSGCWEWQACKDRDGYGKFALWDGKNKKRYNAMAHRYSYLMIIGDFPKEFQIDHLCRNKSCVNPYHLEPVPAPVNAARAWEVRKKRKKKVRKTHCPKGHPFTKENLKSYELKRGQLVCKMCHRDRERDRRRRGYTKLPPKSPKTIPTWSRKIRRRDNNTCKMCGSSEDLHAHHIIPVRKNPKISLSLYNGITLCASCHGSIYLRERKYENRFFGTNRNYEDYEIWAKCGSGTLYAEEVIPAEEIE